MVASFCIDASLIGVTSVSINQAFVDIYNHINIEGSWIIFDLTFSKIEMEDTVTTTFQLQQTGE